MDRDQSHFIGREVTQCGPERPETAFSGPRRAGNVVRIVAYRTTEKAPVPFRWFLALEYHRSRGLPKVQPLAISIERPASLIRKSLERLESGDNEPGLNIRSGHHGSIEIPCRQLPHRSDLGTKPGDACIGNHQGGHLIAEEGSYLECGDSKSLVFNRFPRVFQKLDIAFGRRDHKQHPVGSGIQIRLRQGLGHRKYDPPFEPGISISDAEGSIFLRQGRFVYQ